MNEKPVRRKLYKEIDENYVPPTEQKSLEQQFKELDDFVNSVLQRIKSEEDENK